MVKKIENYEIYSDLVNNQRKKMEANKTGVLTASDLVNGMKEGVKNSKSGNLFECFNKIDDDGNSIDGFYARDDKDITNGNDNIIYWQDDGKFLKQDIGAGTGIVEITQAQFVAENKGAVLEALKGYSSDGNAETKIDDQLKAMVDASSSVGELNDDDLATITENFFSNGDVTIKLDQNGKMQLVAKPPVVAPPPETTTGNTTGTTTGSTTGTTTGTTSAGITVDDLRNKITDAFKDGNGNNLIKDDGDSFLADQRFRTNLVGLTSTNPNLSQSQKDGYAVENFMKKFTALNPGVTTIEINKEYTVQRENDSIYTFSYDGTNFKFQEKDNAVSDADAKQAADAAAAAAKVTNLQTELKNLGIPATSTDVNVLTKKLELGKLGINVGTEDKAILDAIQVKQENGVTTLSGVKGTADKPLNVDLSKANGNIDLENCQNLNLANTNQFNNVAIKMGDSGKSGYITCAANMKVTAMNDNNKFECQSYDKGSTFKLGFSNYWDASKDDASLVGFQNCAIVAQTKDADTKNWNLYDMKKCEFVDLTQGAVGLHNSDGMKMYTLNGFWGEGNTSSDGYKIIDKAYTGLREAGSFEILQKLYGAGALDFWAKQEIASGKDPALVNSHLTADAKTRAQESFNRPLTPEEQALLIDVVRKGVLTASSTSSTASTATSSSRTAPTDASASRTTSTVARQSRR